MHALYSLSFKTRKDKRKTPTIIHDFMMPRPMKRTKARTKASRSTRIERVPKEVLVREVLGRVAASSFTDLFNLKLSCKTFNEIVEDKYVYQSVSLDKFPTDNWYPLNEKQKSFLNKCQEYENPEVLYRQAVIDYFYLGKRRSAYNNLMKAMEIGHTGAQYLRCILMIICGDPESKALGIKYLNEFTKSNTKRVAILCRKNLINYLRNIWVENPDLRESSVCCSNPNQHQLIDVWCGDEEISDEEISECEACNADREIKMLRRNADREIKMLPTTRH